MTAPRPPGDAACPLPLQDYPRIVMGHGGGGRLTHQLIQKLFLAAFGNPLTEPRHDGAVFEADAPRLAFTTDSYVIRPLLFPGGDIGALAVNGTVNDLAMCGAQPVYLSAAFILEEGLKMETLWTVVQSMRRAAEDAGVLLVTGDTKVVDKGRGDGIYINTSGVGRIGHERVIAPAAVRPGDAVLLSGDIGRHGMAIMAVREGLAFESAIESDCAAVTAPVLDLIESGMETHCLRDLTRGGLATALVEIAETAGVRIEIHERTIPVREDVQGACEILGFDPLYVANEGRFIALVPDSQADAALARLNAHPLTSGAVRIGSVEDAADGAGVTLRSRIGPRRRLDRLSGEQLPRIC